MPVTGIILAGGLGKRYNGIDKAHLSIDGRSILDRILDTFDGLFEEIILVTNHPARYASWDLFTVSDLYAVRSSLTGLHAGLFHASHGYAFVTACDMPFTDQRIIRLLLDRIDTRWDAIMPQTEKGLEPLCAVYATRCAGQIGQHIERNQLKIQRVFNPDKILRIPETRFRKIDPDLRCFFNINRPEEFVEAQRWLPQHPNGPS
ncbi:molybdenum cofactor guanylyltransferase [Desulfatirhabdium butyrativorans]|uniref:molybdenum cofactor guanylyltransferase n=1 Tax=Desulfatirhabdium butyrativorans TaxID=340467 RepID=UPI00040E34B0|nr:molybdenum cofactor guanylyltransferase [Desulfatirhabdium butyrativorans]